MQYAIKILEKNVNEINWERLSKNPYAIKLLEKYKNEIDWFNLSRNPNIFYYKKVERVTAKKVEIKAKTTPSSERKRKTKDRKSI